MPRPGGRHLCTNSDLAWIMCGLLGRSSLRGSDEGRTGSVDLIIDRNLMAEGWLGSIRSLMIPRNASWRCGDE